METEGNDFAGFLAEMLNGDALEGPARGIAAKVVADDSMRHLTNAQHATLVIAIKGWLAEHFPDYRSEFTEQGDEPRMPSCREGAHEVPWGEVYLSAVMHRGTCSWCVQVHHKDD